MEKQLVETHFCPANHAYHIVLDHREAMPDDPGSGTPAMVYGPQGTSATFFFALDGGELGGELDYHQLPSNVSRWLESMEDHVGDYVERAFENKGQAA